MVSTSQIVIEVLAGLFFLVTAITCLIWPGKFYEHALKPAYLKSDTRQERLQNLHRKSYIWSVRLIGAVAALIFTFVVIHLFSAKRGSAPLMDSPPELMER
ncbi:MAG TPA: hypothetical protein VK709_10180 [Candidatus Saccharimonadales bacterium]|jgi:hypothetical protein|nr:hypothetical protein [Candidatus Saccharimonadales bacterium]